MPAAGMTAFRTHFTGVIIEKGMLVRKPSLGKVPQRYSLPRFVPIIIGVSSHEYHDVCGERDGVEFAKRRRRDVSDIVEEERQRNRCRPAATLRANGGYG
ncbi:MAG: hypothetical protein V3S50_11230 [Acidobacteriota bacterium]